MQNQPPTTGRPWFRLSSQARVEPGPPPQPRPPAEPQPRPLFRPPVQVPIAPSLIPMPSPPPPQMQPPPPLPTEASFQPPPPPPPPPPQMQPPPPLPTEASFQPPPPPPPPPTPTPEETLPRPPTQPEPQFKPQPQPTPPPSDISPTDLQQIRSRVLSPLTPGTRVSSQLPTPPQTPQDIKSPSNFPRDPLPDLYPVQSLSSAQLKPNPQPESKDPLVSELRPMQKSILVQEESRGSNNMHDEFKRVMTRESRRGNDGLDSWRMKPKGSDTEREDESGMKVITIAGENKGAHMELGSRSHKGRHVQRHKSSHAHTYVEEEHGGGMGDGKAMVLKEKEKEKEKMHSSSSSTTPPISTLVNNNVQGINNSILLNGSCTHRNPGVHISLSRRHPPSPSSSKGTHHPF
ncbi:hypothetical protein QJS04_geneDACA004774 [Acorus gramineus]|uniref:Uncharacterized protein n=1 Tax=Acorus gramineus TaxID=55184 RepID=A0AAV9BTH2_ACOGR|nr:hypothetical protein QJS04_geneDACA004774 [Acorus gramineus]